MSGGWERRLAVAAGTSVLATISSVLVWSRCCGHLGFSAPDDWYEWLTWASGFSTGNVCGIFLVLTLVVYVAMRGRGVAVTSRVLGVLGCGVVISAFVLRLLPPYLVDMLSGVIVGDTLGSDIPSVALEGAVEGMPIWLLGVGICLIGWYVGCVLGSDEHHLLGRVLPLLGTWAAAYFLLFTAKEVSYSSQLGECLLYIVPFWSCWSLIAGVFFAWGGTSAGPRAVMGSTLEKGA